MLIVIVHNTSGQPVLCTECLGGCPPPRINRGDHLFTQKWKLTWSSLCWSSIHSQDHQCRSPPHWSPLCWLSITKDQQYWSPLHWLPLCQSTIASMLIIDLPPGSTVLIASMLIASMLIVDHLYIDHWSTTPPFNSVDRLRVDRRSPLPYTFGLSNL